MGYAMLMSTVSVPWDLDDYAKHVSPKNTGKNIAIKRDIRQRFPPGPAFSDPERVIDIPMTITDRTGCILFWFLPDIVFRNAQVCENTQSLCDPFYRRVRRQIGIDPSPP